MFSKATANFVRQVDRDGRLIHVSRMNDSSKLLPMALVVKRKRVWFWQSPKYQTTDFNLSDLLLGDEVLTPVVSKKDFLKFTGILGDTLTGKFEAEAGSVGLKLEGQGSSKLLSDFGKLKKEELDVKKLLEDSDNRLVDMQHMLVQQLEKQSDVLAVVKERIVTTAACIVTETKKEKCAFHGIVGLLGNLGANIKMCIKESNDIEVDSDFSLEIPSDVVIAYSILELDIKKDGQYEICLQPGKIGGFEADLMRVSSQESLTVVDGRCLDENISEEQIQQDGSHKDDLAPLTALSQSTRWALFCRLQEILSDRVTLSYLQDVLEEVCVNKTLEEHANNDSSMNAVHLLVSALEELPDETLSLICDSQLKFFEAFSTMMSLLKESGVPLSMQFLPTLLWEKEAFQQAEKLLDSVGVALRADGDRLWVEMGEKSGVHMLVLCLSMYGLSLLCRGQKQD
ncbi:gasdermin-E-like [Corythoichthys intestinalis]|uniref:gasdermin-E-like n=1 Tax=Corythoichthys intestinalis TaxID=161448 RepID=UPI0025A5D03B|nr:gasdermin-E-like [Corythoichthys intestinalis]XP_061808196.1 gasdermin-E-like [Nerophis lumbriciformis]